MKYFNPLCLLLTLTLFPLTLMAQKPVDLNQKAFDSFQQGHFEQAIATWEKIRAELSVDDLVLLAIAYQSLGHLKTAYNLLKHLLDNPVLKNDPIGKANVLSHLSELYLALGNLDLENKDMNVLQICGKQKTVQQENLDKALEYIKDAEKLAQNINHPSLMANILNTKGNVRVAEGDLLTVQDDKKAAEKKYAEAVSLYKKSLQQAGDNVLRAKILTNIAQAMAKSDNHAKVEFNDVWQQVRNLPDSHDKAFALISIARILAPEQKFLAHKILTAAIEVAKVVKNKRSIAYAKYYMAQLYANDKRYPEAIRLTREAMFYAQNHPEMLYRLEWNLGKIFNDQNQREKAIHLYRQSAEHAKQFREKCESVSKPFRKQAEELYFELADLLLQQAKEHDTKESLLEEARQNIELFKEAELQNYFQNSCVTQLENNIQNLTKDLPPNTAVLYPILFEDRVELLLTLRQNHQIQTQQFTQRVEKLVLEKEINQFRYDIDVGNRFNEMDKTRKGRQEKAKKTDVEWITGWLKELRRADYMTNLYQSLIKPINDTLQGIKTIETLVIVPDGLLRTLPFAALYNGEKFLIEEDYALVIVPGLTLTDPTPISHRNIKALLTGLSVDISVETGEYPALQAKEELTQISKYLRKNQTLLNENFVIDNLRYLLEQTSYSVVHFATHGHFSKDPNNTFLLTYDAKNDPNDLLRMNCLEALMNITEFRKKPVELLTFSACQTALGDERAALGLAGLAVKSGVRSALATLWSVDDTATREIITDFYNALVIQGLPKAQALRYAQKNWFQEQKNTEYEHPFFWGAFLLIGNWL
jgi:CHAT domain-containing protein